MKLARRVMIVDDHARNVQILIDLLDGEFETRAAFHGEEALEIAESYRPDIVLLDIMMPGIDGYEVCRRLRQMAQLRATKIIMVSARARIEERLQGYEAGADDYLTKPFILDELLAKVRVYSRLRTQEEMNQLQSSLLAYLIAETSTPITTITAAAQLLLGSPGLLEQDESLVQILKVGTDRIKNLVQDIVKLNALKSGEYRFSRVQTTIPELIESIITPGLSEIAAEHKIRIETDLEPNAIIVCDPESVGYSIQVLIENGIGNSRGGGTVLLRSRSDAAFVRIECIDHGPAVSEEDVPILFSESGIESASRSRRNLALTVSKHIVEGHKGLLGYQYEDGGCKFTLALPRPSKDACLFSTANSDES